MSRVVKDAPLTTATARLRLGPGTHWRHLASGLHLGYRKHRETGQAGGVWIWRYYLGGERYWRGELGSADDVLPADGVSTLSFVQAERAAPNAVEARKRQQNATESGAPATVADAVMAYVEMREARSGEKRKRDARSRLVRNLVGGKVRGQAEALKPDILAAKPLTELTKRDLTQWRMRCAQSGISPATVVRLASDLKAALNYVHRLHSDGLPPTFPLVVKDGLAIPIDERPRENPAGARAEQILSIGDVRRLVLAAREIDAERRWEGDLIRLVIVLAATGARFSQIAAMKVGDVQIRERRLMVPVSAKGRGGKATTHVAVAVTQDALDALVPVTVGRKADAPLLERWRYVQVRKLEWKRERREAWLSASELTRPWKAIVARAELSTVLVPYCFRHSSIVRGLRANLPVRLVAALHDTSASMIERHYSAFIVTALDELAASVALPVTEAPEVATVVPFSRPA